MVQMCLSQFISDKYKEKRQMKSEIVDIIAPVCYEQDDTCFAGAAEYCAKGSNMCE